MTTGVGIPTFSIRGVFCDFRSQIQTYCLYILVTGLPATHSFSSKITTALNVQPSKAYSQHPKIKKHASFTKAIQPQQQVSLTTAHKPTTAN
jgi:hypothetical protein